MRFFVSVALLLTVAAVEDNGQFIPKGGKSLEEVYGPMPKVDKLVPWDLKMSNREELPEDYFKLRTPQNCTFPIEVYIVQDETSSFADNFEEMQNQQLKSMHDGITKGHPGSSFGVGTHRDIPIWSLGFPATDYCWKFRLPLSPSLQQLQQAYRSLRSTGGGDAPEYQFGSIIASCQSLAPGWTNRLATRLVVVATDAQPHFEGDGFNDYHLEPYSGYFDEVNPEHQCFTEYYPSPDQVKFAITKRGAHVAFLIFDGDYNQGGKPIDAWNWFNSFIDQPAGFVSDVNRDASDFWTRLAAIIKELELAECVNRPLDCTG